MTPLDSKPFDVLVCEFFLELGPEWFSTDIGGGAGRSMASARKDGLRGARTFDSDEWILTISTRTKLFFYTYYSMYQLQNAVTTRLMEPAEVPPTLDLALWGRWP